MVSCDGWPHTEYFSLLAPCALLQVRESDGTEEVLPPAIYGHSPTTSSFFKGSLMFRTSSAVSLGSGSRDGEGGSDGQGYQLSGGGSSVSRMEREGENGMMGGRSAPGGFPGGKLLSQRSKPSRHHSGESRGETY